MERSQFLQVMRFVAAGLVLCAHITFYYHGRIDGSVPVWEAGGVGVPIFFVISGVVMVLASKALPPGIVGARGFLLRRLIRIVPLWWLALTIKIAIALAWPDMVKHNHFHLEFALKSYFFIPYFSGERAVLPLHSVGWTLHHELFFYLLFSLALLLKLRPVIWVSASILGLWLLGLAWHPSMAWWVVATHEANLQFVLGMALATVLTSPRFDGKPRHGLAFVLAISSAALCMPTLGIEIHFMYPVLMAFAAATLCLAGWPMPRALNWAVRLGDSSYSLYLFHPFIAPAAVLLVAKLLPDTGAWWHMLFVLFFTVLACHLLHLVVEVPIVRMARQRLIDTRTPRVASPRVV